MFLEIDVLKWLNHFYRSGYLSGLLPLCCERFLQGIKFSFFMFRFVDKSQFGFFQYRIFELQRL